MAATWLHGEEAPRPEAVGILALEVYFPTQHVLMSEMETTDGCPGKYTRGLGQEAMSYSSDREDVVSMALTVTQSLLEKYGVRPEEVGHLQVATESGVDRSKSLKSHLMTLFAHPCGAKEQEQQGKEQRQIGGCNGGGQRRLGSGPPAEGADCVHACYGGTAALLAAAAWVESRRWDGRLALVVAADVAMYAPGTAARPTGGCGAAALLVGPDAPLVLDPLWYGSHAEHSWDFFKPLGTLPYPAVDGPQTLLQYLTAAGRCAVALADRLEEAGELAPGEGLLPRVHHFVAHAPFNKLARKGLGRLALMDALRGAGSKGAQAQVGIGAGDPSSCCRHPEGTAASGTPTTSASGLQQQQPQQGLVDTAERVQEPPHEWVQEWVQCEAAASVAAAAGRGQQSGMNPMPKVAVGHVVTDGTVAHIEGASAPAEAATAAATAVATAQPRTGLEASIGACTIAASSDAAAAAGSGGTAKVGSSAVLELARRAGECVAAGLSSSSYATWGLNDKVLEAQLLESTSVEWTEKAEDGAWLQKQVGNSYTACVWQGLASLVCRRGTQLAGRRVLLFSFGSGTIATLLSLVCRGNGEGGGVAFGNGHEVGIAKGNCGAGCEGDSSNPRFTLEVMQRALNLDERLCCRVRRPLAAFDAVSAQVAASYACPVPYQPVGDVSDVAAGSYYLLQVDENSRRWYKRKT